MATDKNRVMELRKQGLTYDEIAHKMGVSRGTIGGIVNRFETTRVVVVVSNDVAEHIQEHYAKPNKVNLTRAASRLLSEIVRDDKLAH